MNEPDWFLEFRNRVETAESNSPDYRHGLSINISPVIDPMGKPFAKSAIISSNEKILVNEDVFNSDKILEFKECLEEISGDDKLQNKMLAECTDIIFIVIPSSSTKKIEIGLAGAGSVLTVILAEKNSKAEILWKKKDEVAESTYIFAKDGSSVTFTAIQEMSGDCLESRKAIISNDAYVNWANLILGADYTRSETSSFLNAPGASTKNKALYLADNDQRMDIYTGSIHNSSNTSSDIVTKGAINGKAKALSRGLVRITSEAPQSDGYEKQDALLLSDTAEADAIPNLEIHNHDVKCSHGSTVGQIDKDKVFYLMSRGLSEKEAQLCIIQGFFSPVLEKLDDEFRETLLVRIMERASHEK
ncbi:SufD family Fe-S cluster assembly protein [Candidatus Woesearchaeota archaeon]|nr:SufD family Fe-S cluster assembly protein [Candidatus Woesearchaeota archaeon]